MSKPSTLAARTKYYDEATAVCLNCDWGRFLHGRRPDELQKLVRYHVSKHGHTVRFNSSQHLIYRPKEQR